MRNPMQQASQLVSVFSLSNSRWRRASRITGLYRLRAAVNTMSSRHLLIAREREHMWHMSARARGHCAWLLQRGTRSYFSWHGSSSQSPRAPVTHAKSEPCSLAQWARSDRQGSKKKRRKKSFLVKGVLWHQGTACSASKWSRNANWCVFFASVRHFFSPPWWLV